MNLHKRSTLFTALALGLAALPVITFPVSALSEETSAPVCLYVASYHQGYAWSDGVERGLRDQLEGHCKISGFYMDAKRRKSENEMQAAGMAAYELIKELKPDVVITSDDHAAKYLIVPHLFDSETPVVFSGINWTVEEYGFPASNITGIVEVAPIKPMLLEGVKANKLPDSKGVKVAYLGAATLTEVKNYNRVKNMAESLGMTVDSILADDYTSWKNGFTVAQDYDMVVMGSNSGVSGFDEADAQQWVKTHTRKLSMTNHEWMMPYTAIGYTKIPEEHGEWAAASSIAILGGVRAIDIPLVTNRRWDTWINSELLTASKVKLEDSTMTKAKKFQ